MTWLILGTNSALAKALMQKISSKEELYATTRRKKDLRQNVLFLDMENDECVENFIPPKAASPKIAFFAISEPKIAKCEEEPEKTYKINVTNTLKLASILSNLGWKIVYPSSSSVFDGTNELAKIDDKVNPTTEYGRQKAFVEQELLARLPNVLIIRFSKIIFADIPLFLNWAHNLYDNKKIKPFSDYVFAPVYESEAINTLINLILKDVKGIWHISSSQEISYAQAAQIIAKALNISFEMIEGIKGKDLYPDQCFPPHASLDASLTESKLEIIFSDPKIVMEKWAKDFLKLNL